MKICLTVENRVIIAFNEATGNIVIWSVAKCRRSRVATKSRGSRVWVAGVGLGCGSWVRVKK